MGAIVTQIEVEAYLSTPIVRATFDDNNDGQVDSRSLALIIASAEALFLAHVRGIVPVIPLPEPIDPFAKDVVLQIVHCKCIKRFPEVFRQGLAICEDVEKLLEQIREGKLQIATPPPATVAASGGLAATSIPSRYLRERDFFAAPRAGDAFYGPADDD